MFRFRISALYWLPKIWSSTSALSFCIDCQKCEVPLPHFRSALTAKYVKFCSRTSALSWLAKIWSSSFRTCSARTSKDVKFRFRISSLPGLAVSLLHFRSVLTAKDLKIGFSTNTLPSLPNMVSSASTIPFCLDCKKICSFTFQICLHSQRCECTSALPWLPEFCLLCSAVGSHYVFPHNFVLTWRISPSKRRGIFIRKPKIKTI